jgi:D-lactate dehydrogenase (quinone)
METTRLHCATPSDPTRPDAAFLDALRAIVGPRHVLVSPRSTRRYRTRFRFGTGPALVVVRPGSLVEQWRVLKAAIRY